MKIPEKLEEIFPLWDTLTGDERQLLTLSTTLRRFEKGRALGREGYDCTGLCLVKEGQLRVFIVSENGREITLYRLFPWDICLFSASCIMKNIDFDMHVEAEKATDVFIIPAGVYEELMKTSLPVSDYTGKLMASRFSDVMWIMEKTLFNSFDSRLAEFLLEQSVIEETDVLSLTHEEIARNLGTAREVVTKMLNYMSGEGLVRLSRGKIALLDKTRLQKLV